MSPSPITVGLLGHTGMIGSKLLAELTTLHKNGTIKLIILHRASSDVSKLAEGVETRVIDLTEKDNAAHDAAVKDLDVLISAIGTTANNAQLNLLPALARSKTLKTFIPSNYGNHWSEEELKTMTNQFIKDKEAIEAKIREAGVPVTTVKSGLISDFSFKFSIGQWDPKGNQVFVNRKSQDTKVPLTTSSYLAAAIAELIPRPLETIANKTFVAIEYEPTNGEIASMLTTIHGRPTKLVEQDDETVHGGVTAPHPLVSLGSAVLRKSGMGWWDFPGAEKVEPKVWKTQGVEVQLRNQIGPLA